MQFLEYPVPQDTVDRFYNQVYAYRQKLLGYESDMWNLVESNYLDVRYQESLRRAIELTRQVTRGLDDYRNRGLKIWPKQYNTFNEIFNQAKTVAHGLGNVIENAKKRTHEDENPFQRIIKDGKKSASDAASDTTEAITDAFSGAGEAISSALGSPGGMAAMLVVLVIVMVVIR